MGSKARSSKGLEGSKTLAKLASKLFPEEEERSQFLKAVTEGRSSRTSVLWVQEPGENNPFPPSAPPAFVPSFVQLVDYNLAPGRHQYHDDGHYYCLDLSSACTASVLTGIEGSPRVVFDICSSPGGKAVFAHTLLKPELLLCNETIGKRTGALISNIERCKIQPALVTSTDTAVFASRAPQSADLVIVDAPCSGQSLVTRGMESKGAFHPSTINLNSNRQKRILANSSSVVAPGGYLAYMTCTYSPEENEEVIKWFLKKFPHFSALEVPSMASHRSQFSEFSCYRFWPFQETGAGGFAALLKNNNEGERLHFDPTDLHLIRDYR